MDLFSWMIPVHRCTGHTLIERIIFLTFSVICKGFCEEQNCFNQLLGAVFINFWKKSNNAEQGMFVIPPPSHSLGGNQWNTTTYNSMRLRPLKTKELDSVNSNNKNVSSFPLFLSSPHDRLSVDSMSGGCLLGPEEPRTGLSGPPCTRLCLRDLIPYFHHMCSIKLEETPQVQPLLSGLAAKFRSNWS